MKVSFILENPYAWQSGIWFHRNEIPTRALKKRGHGVTQIPMLENLPDATLDFADTVIFGRIYTEKLNPLKWIKRYKEKGKRVLYDMDDDFWQVNKDNPSAKVSNVFKDQYEGMIKEADGIITPSHILARKFKKLTKKPIYICPNGIDYTLYSELDRPKGRPLHIGYMGAASHWKDLQIIVPALEELSKDYDFFFVLYGLTGEPIEAAIYNYRKRLEGGFEPEKEEYFKSALDFYAGFKETKMLHIPFHPPELHPDILSRANMDIGLAPLEDTEFNKGKSCIKYYEYAATGAVTVASNVEPYKSEVGYLAKNTTKDWYKKIQRLIEDDEFRENLKKKQQEYVKKHRSIEAIGLDWELACQKPGGLKVLNQQKNAK